MREAPIRAHQCSSVLIRAHQCSSVLISAHQCSSVLISAHQCSSVLIRATTQRAHRLELLNSGARRTVPVG